MITPTHYLFLSALLFVIGMAVTISRRHPLIVLIGIELMLQAVNLTIVSLTGWFEDWSGQIAVFVVITIAAVELAVGLGVVLAYQQRQTSPQSPHL